jgi:hypothetical protein
MATAISSSSATGRQIDVQTSDSSEMRQLSEILDLLKPFIPSIKQVMERPLCKATAFEVALYLIGDIITKLSDLIEKQITFSKIVIQRLWDCETPKGSVNIIELLYTFLTLCGKFPDANFKRSTFGAIMPFNNGKGDINYNITSQQAHIPLGECRFVLAFKMWRSIIGRSITNCTGKYQKPNFKESAQWKYRVQNGKDVNFVSAHDDTDFMIFMEEWADIYEQTDKFSPSLDEVHTIFNEASSIAKAEISAKIEARAMRDAQRKQSHHTERQERRYPQRQERQERQSRQTGVSVYDSTHLHQFTVPAPPPPSRWGTTVGGAAALFKS